MISDENNKLDDVVCCWSALIMRSETEFPFSRFLDQRGEISGVIKLVVAQPLMKCTHFARVIQQSPNELLIFLSVLKLTGNCYLITPAQKKLVVGIQFLLFDSFIHFYLLIGKLELGHLILSLPYCLLFSRCGFLFFRSGQQPNKIKNKNGKESNAQKLSVQFDGHHLFVKL